MYVSVEFSIRTHLKQSEIKNELVKNVFGQETNYLIENLNQHTSSFAKIGSFSMKLK